MAVRRILWIGMAAAALVIVVLFLRSGRRSEVETLTILGEDASTMQAIEAVKGRFESEHGVKVVTTKSAFEVLQQKANADSLFWDQPLRRHS